METVDLMPEQRAIVKTRSLALPYRARIAVIAAPILVAVCLWCWSLFVVQGVFKDGPGVHGTFGGDFTMLISGAAALQQGENPYDHRALLRTERTYLHQRGLPLLVKNLDKIRVGYPPLFFWALQPLVRLPFQAVSVAWIAAMYLLTAVGFLTTLRFLRWRHWVLPALMFLLLPQAVKGALYGNASGLVFAGMGCSLLLLRRRPYAVGALLNLVWLKPQVGFAIVLLIILFHTKDRLKVLTGFTATTGVLLVTTVLTTGWRSLEQWVAGLTGYYHDLTVQTYLPSLVNLYDLWLPLPFRHILVVLCLMLALGVTGIAWLKLRRITPVSAFTASPLWFLWFVVTPYVHLYDEILLALPILACLGRDGHRVVRPLPALGVYVLALSWLPYSWIPWEALTGIAVVSLLNRGAGTRYRSSLALLIGLSLAWMIYGVAPAHGALESLLVVASALCLLSVAFSPRGTRLPRARGTWRSHAAGP